MYGGKFAFQNRLGQLIVGTKFTVFALFYFVFEGNFQVQAPGGAYIRRGDLTEGFLRYDFEGLIFGGAYTWRGLFSEFYGIYLLQILFYYFYRNTVYNVCCRYTSCNLKQKLVLFIHIVPGINIVDF